MSHRAYIYENWGSSREQSNDTKTSPYNMIFTREIIVTQKTRNFDLRSWMMAFRWWDAAGKKAYATVKLGC